MLIEYRTWTNAAKEYYLRVISVIYQYNQQLAAYLTNEAEQIFFLKKKKRWTSNFSTLKLGKFTTEGFFMIRLSVILLVTVHGHICDTGKDNKRPLDLV